VVERMALALQASLLVRYGDETVADAFCASRLSGDWGRAFGTLPAGIDYACIIERAAPHA
jgi:putative acyl-CoA dehydrogenase